MKKLTTLITLATVLSSAGVSARFDSSYNELSTHGRHERSRHISFEQQIRNEAIELASDTIAMTKKMEPYVNNTFEASLDEIKKQAIRLRSRAKAGRDIQVVENTLRELERQIDDLEVDLFEFAESDNLDRPVEILLTIKEKIVAFFE